ncbi:FtsX-like permease family protein [Acinetobacter sp. 187]|uniref:ABC transporter permease n=1 Tax=Acinetobacter lanii TaxID=2715163 RepID=UPI00140BDE30|nr:FtsX-like permease family protein [Acinetobacter lanii]NHC04440.1 FtsX-like permease family protein [Acinetobacter lanii]
MMGLVQPLFRQSFASSGVYLLIIALSLAISATTALKFSNAQIQQAVFLQAAKMQAADLVLTDNVPISAQWKEIAQRERLKQSEVTVFSSMAYTQDNFVMVNVKAIDADFPLRGELKVQPAQAPIASGQVWLSQRSMDLLQVKIGDTLNIADAGFKVSAVIEKDNNQELGFSAFSPTVIISQQDIERTHAIQTGSRIDYRLLLAGEPNQLKNFEQQFKAHTPQGEGQHQHLQRETMDNDAASSSSLKLRKADDGNTRLMKPIQNLDTFLQLANILTILLCGIAIALSSQRYVQQNQDHIALMRCMGASKAQILKAYLLLLLIIIGIAMLLGSGVGLALGYGLLQLMLQLIPHLELQFSLWEMLWGPLPIAIFTSAIVLLGFVLPSLAQLLNTPPIRVIRQQEKSVRSLWVMFVAGLLSLVVFSLVLTSNIMLSALVMGAMLLLSALLFLMVWILLKSIKALKNRWSSYVRTPSQTALQITALALGLSLMTVLVVLRLDLLERWQQQLPAGTPNQFVYGLPPFEVDQFKQQLQAKGWNSTPLYPNVKGRLIAHNGKPFDPALVKTNNALRRELNLTQANQYPKDNLIVSGRSNLTQAGEVSVEAKLAKGLGIQLGDQLTFSLPEGELQAKVVNLRQVEWESFSPNFFFIFAPQSMDENAGSYLGSFYVPPEQKSQLVALIQQFSNTVFIDVSLMLQEVKNLVNVLVQIITVLALLVSLSGFLVLMACINLLMDERKKEVALLRSFGSSKAHLKNMMSLEIGLIGLIAGIVSCLFAEVMSVIVSQKMNLEPQLHFEIWLILPLLMLVLCALIGRYRLSYLSDIAPLQSLRELNQ